MDDDFATRTGALISTTDVPAIAEGNRQCAYSPYLAPRSGVRYASHRSELRTLQKRWQVSELVVRSHGARTRPHGWGLTTPEVRLSKSGASLRVTPFAVEGNMVPDYDPPSENAV